MKTVSENTLKSRMSELFHELEATGEELQVTENGKVIMKIISYRRELGDAESCNEHGAAS